ncbi:MAG: plasmid recombination protein [Tetragenococcus koreensis]|nr:plasmid recombination protein [Tetragenococcus koreensis]
MSMIVARMQKMKAGNLVGIGNHNQRKSENHANKEIDVSKAHLNYDLVNRTENYKRDIEQFIEENKSTTRAVRKDAVLVNEWIISSDRDFFDDLSERETENFFERSKDYFAEKFGEENVRYATVHLDESTPHMHLGIVPFDKDKKLSAKRVFNRQALRDVQEELPDYLQRYRYEIERGRKGSDRKNLTVPEFKEMKKEQQQMEEKKDLAIEVAETKRQELLAYVRDKEIDWDFKDIQAKKELKEVKVPTGEKFLGIERTETVMKPTGNYIISAADLKRVQELNEHSQKREAKLQSVLDTDFYKENKGLRKELNQQISKNNEDIEDYNQLFRRFGKLKEENSLLKGEIRLLKKEISLIYKSTKNFLKERTSDIQAFKTLFKDLVEDITEKVKVLTGKNHFKDEFDRENRPKRNRGMGGRSR